MPLYEFRCHDCDDTFELRRPMAEAGDPAPCPDGHLNTVKLLSVFASVGASTGSAAGSSAASASAPSGGGCGGHCACH